MLDWTPSLYRIAEALGSAEETDARVTHVLVFLADYVPYDRCALIEMRHALTKPVALVPPGLPPHEQTRLVARATAILETLVDQSSRPHAQADVSPRGATVAHLAVPLFSLGDIVGLLLVEHDSKAYDPSHLAFLSVVAAQLGAYLTAVVADRDTRAIATELRITQERIQAVLTAAPLVLSNQDTSLRYTWAHNPTAFFGTISPLGKTDAELLPGDDGTRLNAIKQQVLDSGTGCRTEVSVQCGAERRTFDFTAEPLRDVTGLVTGVGCAALDVTELLRAQGALREADHQKDVFLATLAHELRNPLAPLRNAAKFVAAHAAADPEVQWATQVIDRHIQHMSRLLDDLLDVSRIARNTVELRRTRADLAAIVAVAVETSRPVIEARGHELTVTAAADSVVVDADATRLAQVFSNLLNNAAKFTPHGGRITLNVARHGDQAIVSIADNGQGIRRELLSRIFEMFVQAQDNRTVPHDGLGIGLALAKRLVELHDGQIQAHSEGPGRGSTFTVILPVCAAAVEADREPGEQFGPTTPPLKFLIVDDNRDSADSLAILLQLQKHECRVTYDGRAVAELVTSFQPDVVVLDLGMPHINGYEVCRQIRGTIWGARALVIAVTGWGQDEDRRKTHEAGFDSHLVKPVDPDRLMALVSQTMSAARCRRVESPAV